MLHSGSKVMHPKYYENSNKSSTFLFLADCAVRAVLKISSILLNNATFEGSFLNIFMGKTNNKLDFLYITVFVLKK